MKPVVSSLVALAIAIAPLAAFAGEKATHGKPVAHKVEKHRKHAKRDKEDKPIVVTVKHTIGKKTGKVTPKHASGVDFGGDHGEPKLVKTASSKVAPRINKADIKAAAPTPKKSAKEKAPAKKASKKADDSANDGATERDEDFAELVARIRNVGSIAEDGERARARHEPARTRAPHEPAPICMKEPVEIVRGPEIDRFELTRCDGTIAPGAIERLSVLVRPGSSPRPLETIDELQKKKGPDLSLGIKRVDGRLVERIQAVVDKFRQPGVAPKINIISGYRPSSIGSMHANGRAVDFRLEGAKNEEVVAFCKTLMDTGCGYYPNSSFVHIDVRDIGSGHVTWIDASGAGESPRYVDAWPPKPKPEPNAEEERKPALRVSQPLIDREAAPEPADSHPPLPPPDAK